KKADQFRLSWEPRALSCAVSENCSSPRLENEFSGCETRRENEWRDLRAHNLLGPKAAASSFGHVVRNAGGWIARRPSPCTNNCIVKYCLLLRRRRPEKGKA